MKNSCFLIRFITKYKVLSIFILILWIWGIIFSVNLMSKPSSKPQHLPAEVPRVEFPLPNQPLPPSSTFRLAKAMHYCNPPSHPPSGKEGIISDDEPIPKEMHLQLVLMLTRHGDRAPLRPIQNLSSIDCGTSHFPNLVGHYSQAMRAARRYEEDREAKDPFLSFPFLPSSHSCSLQQLTMVGALQHLLLGSYIADAYLDKWLLLGNYTELINSKNQNFNVNDVVKVYCTVYPRTFQSAIAFLHGFLPHANVAHFKFIPSFDPNLCLNPEFCKCPKISILLAKLDFKRKQLLDSHPAVVQLLEKVIPIVLTPDQVASQLSPSAVLDALLAFVCHGFPLPCPSIDHCITLDHARNLISFLEWQGRQLAEDVTFKKLSLLLSFGLLSNILENIETILVAGKSSHRFVLYSGHDITIIPLSSALGFYDGLNPPYSSRIAFEVYSNSTHPTSLAFRVLYNGKDVTKSIPFCSQLAGDQEAINISPSTRFLCPVENLRHFLKVEVLKILNAESYAEACSMKD